LVVAIGCPFVGSEGHFNEQRTMSNLILVDCHNFYFSDRVIPSTFGMRAQFLSTLPCLQRSI
ncbi:MAG: hypothetical protein AB4290_04015, partial [Spirulina sp.]